MSDNHPLPNTPLKISEQVPKIVPLRPHIFVSIRLKRCFQLFNHEKTPFLDKIQSRKAQPRKKVGGPVEGVYLSRVSFPPSCRRVQLDKIQSREAAPHNRNLLQEHLFQTVGL